MILVLREEPEDIPSIQKVTELAFGRPVEAELVNRLRDQQGAATLSLVAVEEGQIVGHMTKIF
jgi:putative acetyltransferase